MMTLFDVSARKVAFCIYEGLFKDLKITFDVESSNRIFHEIRRNHPDLTEDVVLQMTEKLRVSKVDFTEFPVTDLDIRFLKTQILECLTIGNLGGTSFSKGRRFMEKVVDIPEILKVLFHQCQSSISKLVHLDLTTHEFYSSFQDGWAEQSMLGLFPNLKSLTAQNKRIRQPDISHIFLVMGNLSILNIDYCTLDTIDGIGNLKNLKKLSMTRVIINKHEGLKEIFELDQLETLNIGGERLCDTCSRDVAEILVETKKSLPSLKFMDCSESNINDDTVATLKLQFPALEKLVAFDTRVQTSLIRGVEVLTAITPKETVKLLRYHLKERRSEVALAVLHYTLQQHFWSRSVPLRVEESRDYFDVVCDMMDVFRNSPISHMEPMKLLGQMTTNSRIDDFDDARKYRLVNLIHELYRRFPVNSRLNTKNVRYMALEMLSHPKLLRLPGLDLRKIYFLMLTEYKKTDLCCGLYGPRIMLSALKHMDSDTRQSIATDRKHVSHLLRLLDKFKGHMFSYYYSVTLDLLTFMVQNVDGCPFVKLCGIDRIVNHIEGFRRKMEDSGSKRALIRILKLLEFFAKRPNPSYQATFSKTKNLQAIAKLLRGKCKKGLPVVRITATTEILASIAISADDRLSDSLYMQILDRHLENFSTNPKMKIIQKKNRRLFDFEKAKEMIENSKSDGLILWTLWTVERFMKSRMFDAGQFSNELMPLLRKLKEDPRRRISSKADYIIKNTEINTPIEVPRVEFVASS